jgi:Helicase HerA, central domain/TraM recognition site of TraD and TraG
MAVLIGRNRGTGGAIRLAAEDLKTHVLILGATSSGKTTLMEGMIRQHIDAKEGVLVMDPHGELYDKLVAYCHVNKSHLSRLYLIDANEEAYRVGINYFDLPGLDRDTKAQFVLAGLYKAFGHSTEEASRVLLERWGMASLRALEPVGLTLAELYDFIENPDFRDTVLLQVNDPFLNKEWAYFESLSQRDKDFHLLALFNRAVKFARAEKTRQIFGQPSSIDWFKVMDEGGIVLVNLLPKSTSPDLMKVIGISTLHQVYANAKRRPKNDPRTKQFFAYIDEFSQLVSEDYIKAMRELRGFGVHFVLSQQDLNDLKRADEHEILFNTVLNNTDVKIVFHLGNYNEALEMAKHLFSPQITGEEIKTEITQAIPEVYDDTVEITTHSDSSSSSLQEIITGDGLLFGDSFDHARTSSESSSYTTTEMSVQRVDYSYEKIPVYRSLEESLHNAASSIMAQGVGEAQVLYNPKLPPRPLKTKKPSGYRTTERYIEATKEAVFRRMGLLSPAEVDAILEARTMNVLAAGTVQALEYRGDPLAIPETASKSPVLALPAARKARRRSRRPYKPRSRPPKA